LDHFWCWDKPRATLTHWTHHGPDSGQATTFPHIVFFALLRDTRIQMSWFGLPGLWELITPDSNLWLGQSLKQTCSSPQELSNGVSHSICTHQGQVHSWLLVVGSQIASLTPGPSFDHNLCSTYPNGSCEAILDIYTSRPFQRYKKQLKVRCFDLYNRALKLRKSRRTPSSHFWECESHLHTCFKVGLRHSHLPQSGVVTPGNRTWTKFESINLNYLPNGKNFGCHTSLLCCEIGRVKRSSKFWC